MSDPQNTPQQPEEHPLVALGWTVSALGRTLLQLCRTDPWVQGVVAAFLGVVTLSLLPPNPARIFLSADLAPTLFLGGALAALCLGPRRPSGSGEQKFWDRITVAYGFWFVALLSSLFQPALESLKSTLWAEALYAAFFVTIILALEQRPHAPGGRLQPLDHPVRPLPGSTWLAMVALVVGLFAYIIAIPALITPEFSGDPLASLVLYLILDGYIFTRFAYRAVTVDSFRWRTLYGLLAVTLCLALLTDLLEALIITLPHFRWGTPADALWSLPFIGLYIAAQARHLRQPVPPGAMIGEPPMRHLSSSSLQGFVIAFVLPGMHLIYYALAKPPERLERAHEALVLVWLLSMGLFAAWQHERLRRHLRSLRRDQQSFEEVIQDSETDIRLVVEQRRAETVLKDSDEPFARVFDLCPEAIAITSLPEGRYLEVNRRFADMLGFEVSEVAGKTSRELGVWVDSTQRQRLIEAIQSQNRVHQLALNLRNSKGEMRDVLVSAERLEIGGQWCMLSVSIDITHRRRLVNTLKRQTKILDLAQAAILGLDRDFRILYWNPTAAHLTGFNPEAARFQPLGTFVNDPSHLSTIRRRCARGEPWTLEFDLHGLDNRLIHLTSCWVPIASGGKPVSWLVFGLHRPLDPPRVNR